MNISDKRYTPLSHTRSARVAALLLISLVAPFALGAHDFSENGITVTHPYAAPTPPGAKIAAGYVVLVNTSEADDRFVGASASFSERVEIHRTEVVDDVARMREMEDGLPITAGGAVTLQPGDLHLMFIGLKKPLVEGELRKVTLNFEKAGALDVEFMVQPVANAEPMNHEGMDHSGNGPEMDGEVDREMDGEMEGMEHDTMNQPEDMKGKQH